MKRRGVCEPARDGIALAGEEDASGESAERRVPNETILGRIVPPAGRARSLNDLAKRASEIPRKVIDRRRCRRIIERDSGIELSVMLAC